MRIDTTLAALRDDPAPVIRAADAADAALARWRATPAAARLLAELADYGAGQDLRECPHLSNLMGNGDAGAVHTMLADLCTVLADHPLGQPALAATRSAGACRMTLASAGRASLSLALAEPTRSDAGAPDHAVFGGGQMQLRVLAGAARGFLASRDGELVPVHLATGFACALDLDRRTLELVAVDSPLMTLRLHRRAADAGVLQDIALTDGAVLAQSADDPRESRIEMAMALLGRMGRVDAAPALAACSREGSAPRRWQALRECLALDAATGFAALLETMERPGDPLRADARALAEALASQHPALARMMEDVTCPA